MNKTGLVSISFRPLSAEDILEASARAGLDAIEWGGDVHVPHGNISEAKRVARLTERYGLKTAEYGSYYKIGKHDVDFSGVVASADALGTSVIRVWPGLGLMTSELTADDYAYMVQDAKRICDVAKDMTVALECHPYSLTEDYSSALKFLSDVGKENLKMFWQPNQYRDLEYNLSAIRALLPHIVSVHTFFWRKDDKYPLSDGLDIWSRYVDLLGQKELSYMLEFMPDGRIETLKGEADTLKKLLSGT